MTQNLIDKITELDEQAATFHGHDDDLCFEIIEEIRLMQKENCKLKKYLQAERERSQKLAKALEFYASERNWCVTDSESGKYSVTWMQEFADLDDSPIDEWAGRIARQALQEYRGSEDV